MCYENKANAKLYRKNLLGSLSETITENVRPTRSTMKQSRLLKPGVMADGSPRNGHIWRFYLPRTRTLCATIDYLCGPFFSRVVSNVLKLPEYHSTYDPTFNTLFRNKGWHKTCFYLLRCWYM